MTDEAVELEYATPETTKPVEQAILKVLLARDDFVRCDTLLSATLACVRVALALRAAYEARGPKRPTAATLRDENDVLLRQVMKILRPDAYWAAEVH